MKKEMFGAFKKIKRRRILVISGGALQGGIHCCYIGVANDSWEIIDSYSIPYPQKISQLFERLSDNPSQCIGLADLAWLDYRLSIIYMECAKTALSKLPTALRKPHLAVVNQPSVWLGANGEDQQQSYWNLPLGDVQLLSSMLGIPVVTDMVRHRCLAGGRGVLPVQYGNMRIAESIGGVVIFVNIGLISHMTIIDTGKKEVLIDSDTGPGTCCINTLMKRNEKLWVKDGFDRDGSTALKGKVDGDCLKLLSESPWFTKPAPKQAFPYLFNELLQLPELVSLNEFDQLATITALTARTIYDFYRREFRQVTSGQSVFVSGGGSNNMTLVQYLKTFFDTIPVKSVEEIGIPVEMRVPLALGLTVDGFVRGIDIPWESGSTPQIRPIGKWVWP